MIGYHLSRLDVEFDRVLVSPLGRCQQTVSEIRKCGVFPEPEPDECLAEVSLGSWDGLTNFDIVNQSPDLLEGTSAFDWYFRSPDGESYEAAYARASKWLDKQSGTVLAVSHGLVGRLIRGAYLGLTQVETLSLPVPQDIVWHLSNGEIGAMTVV
ncbi:bifunctional RNase H/acid phosphatase [Paraurantiacibacter namhicola]|uniref:Bifunctional RNase H/acid phosphatase n=2 Tax=Paraurantiacibacter namhicola TaxID=645517 RepID=A0A1C7D7L3_9SPHN|nr:bifunctional RNase H/acid phosphatase [Paraurantiacibacter namhicola]